jgi:hypothetical protein
MTQNNQSISPLRQRMIEDMSCILARPEGLEPPTTWFEARYSIQLSYGRVFGMLMAGQYKRKYRALAPGS